VNLSGLHRLVPPLALSELRAHLPPRAWAGLRGHGKNKWSVLSDSASAAFDLALRSARPDLVGVLDRLSSPAARLQRGGAARRWLSERDAVRLALRATLLSDDRLAAWSAPSSDAPFLTGLLRSPHEATIIDHDASRLPGWEALPPVRSDVHVFTDGIRRLVSCAGSSLEKS